MSNQFHTIIHEFSGKRVLVIGEAFLDTYYAGAADRICREAPVPIVDVTKRSYAPGGAANVAVNVATLGAQSIFLSVIGKDQEGDLLAHELNRAGVETGLLSQIKERETIAKTRVMAESQMLVRFDTGSAGPLGTSAEEELIASLIDAWEESDAVIISDYGYGIITDAVIRTIRKLQSALPRILVVDSKELDRYAGLRASAVKPNYKEAVSLLGLTKIERGEQRIRQISDRKYELLERTNAALVAVTFDAEGALLLDRGGSAYRTYADRVDNPNVAGAGDTYVAVLAIALAAGAESREAAEIAAQASKVIVRKSGTAFCTAGELITSLSANDKVVSEREQLRELVTSLKRQGKRIVVSNGCFDILHSGHVRYLNQAKAFGDVLILGVNTDESIHALKGAERPINTLSDRLQVLSALSSVTYLVPMPERTAGQLVKLIKPDVYVKGGDYTLRTLPEAKIVQRYGGKVELIPTVEGKSTTGIIRRIQGDGVGVVRQP